MSEQDFDGSGEPRPQAKGVNHLETPLRYLHVTHRASSAASSAGKCATYDKSQVVSPKIKLCVCVCVCVCVCERAIS